MVKRVSRKRRSRSKKKVSRRRISRSKKKVSRRRRSRSKKRVSRRRRSRSKKRVSRRRILKGAAMTSEAARDPHGTSLVDWEQKIPIEYLRAQEAKDDAEAFGKKPSVSDRERLTRKFRKKVKSSPSRTKFDKTKTTMSTDDAAQSAKELENQVRIDAFRTKAKLSPSRTKFAKKKTKKSPRDAEVSAKKLAAAFDNQSPPPPTTTTEASEQSSLFDNAMAKLRKGHPPPAGDLLASVLAAGT